MRYHSYLNSAKKIIGSYKADEPLASFLKKFFAANKKYGSKDRKQIAALCYDFYRLGKALPGIPVEERIINAVFVCEDIPNDFLNFHKPEWNEVISKPLPEKISIAGINAEAIFPWEDELSAGIDLNSFCSSFLKQPDLFIRIRPGQKKNLIEKLQNADLSFEMRGDDCITLPNASKLDDIIQVDKDAVVQDHNSQQVLNFLKDQAVTRLPAIAWDCCAASGGKSILLYDILNGDVHLSVSDIRESILANLKKRFSVAGIKNYRSFIADLSKEKYLAGNDQYSIIICDAPCTGSGTWSRTPEQLYYFDTGMIDAYAKKQRQIVANVIPQLEKNGLFFYITCSVFKKENEEIVNFIEEKFHLHLLQVESLKGFDKKADSMFVAVFTKN